MLSMLQVKSEEFYHLNINDRKRDNQHATKTSMHILQYIGPYFCDTILLWFLVMRYM